MSFIGMEPRADFLDADFLPGNQEKNEENLLNNETNENGEEDDSEEKSYSHNDEDLVSFGGGSYPVETFHPPLIAAAKFGKFTTVQSLLSRGADKNSVTNAGRTALWHAASEGYLKIVRLLVEQGADMEIYDTTRDVGSTPLWIAVSCGHLKVVRYLLEQGADRDKANEDGDTPLHIAAMESHNDIAKLLMVYGADLNASNVLDESPIDCARNEEIRQAIRDEPRRRLDEAPGKRATEEDRHPTAATSASAQQEYAEDEEEEQQSNKRPRLDEEVAEAVETKVAEEDEGSEPSSDVDGDD